MKRPAGAMRRQAERRGRWAETWAALYLWLKGYRIVARRARTAYGEVDIAALKGDVLAIIEVKARTSKRAGIEAITQRQRTRIGLAGVALSQRLSARWGRTGLKLRIDVVVVLPNGAILHERDAWRMEGG
jgi:putative endonuclease